MASFEERLPIIVQCPVLVGCGESSKKPAVLAHLLGRSAHILAQAGAWLAGAAVNFHKYSWFVLSEWALSVLSVLIDDW